MLSRHSIGTASVPAGRNIWTHLTGDQCSHGGGRDHLRQRPAAAPRAVYLLLLQGKWPCMFLCVFVFLSRRHSPHQATQEKVLSATTSGGVCINDTVYHAGNPSLPFGGKECCDVAHKIKLVTGMSHPCSLHVWLSAIHDVFMQFCVTWASFSDCFAQILCCNRHWSVWFGLLPRQIWLRRLFPLKSRPVRTHLVRSSSPV